MIPNFAKPNHLPRRSAPQLANYALHGSHHFGALLRRDDLFVRKVRPRFRKTNTPSGRLSSFGGASSCEPGENGVAGAPPSICSFASFQVFASEAGLPVIKQISNARTTRRLFFRSIRAAASGSSAIRRACSSSIRSSPIPSGDAGSVPAFPKAHASVPSDRGRFLPQLKPAFLEIGSRRWRD